MLKIYLIEQKIYPNHQEEWYVYHSDLSWYVSDCTVSVSLRWVIRLSQWFIMVCLWLYCISITQMSDTSITVIYHGMSLTVLYQYHQDEWYVYHSDLSWYVSDCTVSVSPRWVIHLSQWFIMVCLWLYYTRNTGPFSLALFINQPNPITTCLSERIHLIDAWFKEVILCKHTIVISLEDHGNQGNHTFSVYNINQSNGSIYNINQSNRCVIVKIVIM